MCGKLEMNEILILLKSRHKNFEYQSDIYVEEYEILALCRGQNKHRCGHSHSHSVPELLKGVGVLVGLAVLLRLIGSSSSPSEKNWPLLEVVVAGDLRLSRSE